jgi:multidrug efflux pump
MNITGWALKNRTTTLVALIVVLFAGVSAYNKMPRDEDPGFIIRWAQVITQFPGANPERVEMLISDKIEKVIQEMPELKHVMSTSRTGVSIVNIQVKDKYRDLRPVWDKLRRKIDKVRPQLPSGIIGPEVNDEFGDVFGVVVALTGEGFTYAELKRVADEVREEFLLLDDVAKVNIHGAQQERVFVEYSNTKLTQMGLTIYQLLNILQKRNIIIPGGYVTTGDERIALEPTGNFESLDQIKRTVVGLPGPGGRVMQLNDIVTIRRGYIDPPASKMRFSGRPALGLAISLREGGNMVRLGEQVRPLLQRLRAAYPWGVELDVVNFQPDVVTQKVDEFTTSLLQAVLIVIAVMLLTLGLRTGLVVASLIPCAIVMALLVMSVIGIGLDQMSLASLMISLGLLVDNAIVMSESIMVRMERGGKAVDAALSSAKELRIPLFVASLTTAAAFLPIFLAESDVGEYTAPLFMVVSITLLCSWVLALTMTPLLCVYFLKIKKKRLAQKSADPFGGTFYNLYRRSILAMLRHRLLSGVAVVLIFFGVMQLMRFVPATFFPPQKAPVLLGDIELPAGTPIEKTEEVVTAIEGYVRRELTVNEQRKEGVVNWASYVGDGGPKFRLAYNVRAVAPAYASMVINTSSGDATEEIKGKLNAFAQANFPDLLANFKGLAYGPPVNNPIEVKLMGRDLEQLYAKAKLVKARLRKIPGTRNVDDNWGRPTKKMLVQVNQARARRAGVTNEDIALSLQTAFSGFQNTAFRERDKEIPITLRSVAADRQDVGKIETLSVHSQRTGRAVPLKQVADTEVVWTPGQILREDRLKSIIVRSQLQPGVMASQVEQQLKPWLEAQGAQWGISTRWELGGMDKASNEGNQSINEKLPLAGFIILMLLVGQFNGVRKPLIILTTIPLALIGVVLGLLIARSYFGFMTLLGVVSLAGIVINNGIVLLDRIRIEIEDNGLTPQRAIIQAAQERLRPILLTTVTTMGGLIPLWMAGGMYEPMAIVIIFGLAFSTLLTLGFVPLFYATLFRVKFKGFSW